MATTPVRLSLEITGLERLKQDSARVRQAYPKLVEDVASVMEYETRKLAKPHQVDTGELARSIVSDLSGVKTSLKARVWSNHPAAVPMEYGRRAGSRMPPRQPIADWVRRHGIAAPVFLIQRSIARKGTRPLAMFKGGLERTQERLDGIVRKFEAYLVGVWP